MSQYATLPRGEMRRRTDVVATLRERIINGVHFGRIAAGDRLPSARQLAVELNADPRVVVAAYAQLEREGMVSRRNGTRGYFAIVNRAPTGSLVPSTEWMVETLSQGITRGVPVGRFVEHARRSLETVRIHTACIECNDDQLRWLCGELEDDYGFFTHSFNTREVCDRCQLPPRLEHVDLLVTTVAHASDVLPIANRLGKPLVLVTLRPEIVAEVRRLLVEGPVYYLCTDPRFVSKLHALYRDTPGAENVRPVLLGANDPMAIPTGAPAWIMRSASESMGGIPPHLHALSTARIFSEDTARELVSYLVRANLAAADAIHSTRPTN